MLTKGTTLPNSAKSLSPTQMHTNRIPSCSAKELMPLPDTRSMPMAVRFPSGMRPPYILGSVSFVTVET